MSEPDLAAATVEDAASLLRSGAVSSVELTEAVLRRADEFDGALGVYVTRFDDHARRSAQQADDELARGVDRGPLHGIPIGVKDLLAAREGATTAQSIVLDPAWGEGRDAPAVRRLRDAGAVIVGKTTTSEFAAGMPEPGRRFPVPRNPWDLGCWPGGSSSGTGAGVAAGFFPVGVGSDSAGSIRIPAAFCGVTGLMPTYGRVPKSGCVPLSFSLDRVGPLARTARDCGIALAVMAGFDASDPSSSRREVPDFVGTDVDGLHGLRVGIVGDPAMLEGADAAVGEAFEACISVLRGAGATVRSVSLPYYDETVAAVNLTLAAEALAYHQPDLNSRWADYHRSTRLTAAGGAMATAADYVQAQRVRRLVQRALRELFAQLDLIASPTLTMGAGRYGEGLSLPVADMVRHFHTAYWNGTGLPAIALPMGFTADGLPLSLQLVGRPFDEALLISAGVAFQDRTDWHLARPPLTSTLLPSAATEAPAGAASDVGSGVGPDAGSAVPGEVAALLARARLAPSPEELAELAAVFEHGQQAIASMRAVPGLREEESALVFQAEPPLSEWG